ncbi:hypothetical protein FXO38_11336 [Capsicum annuum]|nr:hypothetical protein FXO38_11336 [Capsicum annuum]
MLQAIQVWLYECCSNVPPKIASKVDNRILRLLNWKTNAPRPHFEFLMDAMFKDGDKVVFKNIEPTQTKLAKFQIPQKDVIEDECSVDYDGDFKDPPPKQINEHSKKIKDELLPSLNAYLRESVVTHSSTIREEETSDEYFNDKKSESIVQDHCQIKKLAEIIPLYLQSCDFYNKKGIDLQNHPKYKDKDYLSLFDMIFEENLPQQLSESLDCDLFMVTYAECLSYGLKVITTDFDPNALRTKYVALLWD